MMGTVNYKVHLHDDTFQKAKQYQQALAAGQSAAGGYLRQMLVGQQISQFSVEDFLERLIRTKKPQIFAESSLVGDGSDWNYDELSILGDVGISVPVTVFDDGERNTPQIHPAPFSAELLFIPGALLAGEQGPVPVDQLEVVANNQIDEKAYYRLYERRLLPLFVHADTVSAQKNLQAFITLPGIGCGYFAGKFKPYLKPILEKTLRAFLEKHIARFTNIRAVYFDPYTGLDNARYEIEHLSFMVRPLRQGNQTKPQLCPPKHYEEARDDFSNCTLFSVVAWDHVSWPGNDFYIGSRVSDDGVKAAATSSMAVMTGIEGKYNPQKNLYEPPAGYRNWEEVVLRNEIQLEVRDNLTVVL